MFGDEDDAGPASKPASRPAASAAPAAESKPPAEAPGSTATAVPRPLPAAPSIPQPVSTQVSITACFFAVCDPQYDVSPLVPGESNGMLVVLCMVCRDFHFRFEMPQNN